MTQKPKRPKLHLPAQTAKAFLAVAAGTSARPCFTCRVPEVAASLAEWAASREAGGKTSLNRFYEEYLQVVYVGCPSRTAIRNHVLGCMRRRVSDGRRIDDVTK